MLQLSQHFYTIFYKSDLLNSLITFSSDGIILFDRNHKIIECNPSFQILAGLSKNEIINSALSDHLRLQKHHVEKLLSGEYIEMKNETFYFKNFSGNCDELILPVIIEKKFEGGLVIITKTSDEALSFSKQALYYSEERFRLISKATNESLYDWNFETEELWFNEIFVEKFGFNEKNLKNGYEFWKNHIHPNDRERVVNGLETAISEGKTAWKDEYQFLNTKGFYSFIFDRGFIIRNQNGEPVRMVGAMMEVRDVKKIEEKLNESYENYEFLAESMPQLVWVMNEKGEGIYYNRKWSDYTGQEFDQYTKWGWTDVIHPDDLPKVLETWQHVLPIACEYKIEYRLRSKFGEYRWFLSRAVPMRNNQGKVLKWIGTPTDIHDERILLDNLAESRRVLKELNYKLNNSNDQLKRINKELDNFVYSASHDLRSPVRNIESLIQLVNDEIKTINNPTVKNYLELLSKSIQNLKKTINDLTEVAKIEEGTDKEEIEIQDIIKDVLFSISDLIKQSNAEIKSELFVKKITFSPKNLRSILYNLLTNSIKYRSPGKKPLIKIKTFLIDEIFCLCVEDNGLGIKKEDISKIFEPFKRIHHQVEGSGMGMSIVKRIVDNNNGTILVESEVNKGTTIKILLKP